MSNIMAFPSGVQQDSLQAGSESLHEGMSLRDYFAAAALQGMLCNGFMPSEVSQHGHTPYDYPGAAYEIADAMLKRRDR